MQNNINTIIDELKGHLSKLNKMVKMSTPFLHDTITEYKGRKQDRYLIYRWDLLRDGLHASDILADKWASVLQNCFCLNRRNDDSDDDNRSPKRSWRRESKAPRLEQYIIHSSLPEQRGSPTSQPRNKGHPSLNHFMFPRACFFHSLQC